VQSLPQRQSLVAQTVTFLHAQIDRGEWRKWLPSERALCELLQVSRNTLRAALVQLQKQGRIRPVHGAGNQILGGKAARPVRVPSPDVALLTPEPIERLRPMQTLWIDNLRALLSERGARLRVFHGSHYYSANPARALQKLVTRNPHGCWILMLATEALQRWFSKHPYHYLALASRLTAGGVRIPQDMSIITRDDDPFLDYVVPEPARYVVNPQLMAKILVRPVLELLEGNVVAQRAARIMPEFLRGETIAPPPAGSLM
jgi:DNA-binding transcriptional regulator YhcF (GntR family)